MLEVSHHPADALGSTMIVLDLRHSATTDLAGLLVDCAIGAGDVSVVVAVSCPHRHQAFDACRWLIDTLKEVVPIWTRETWADGTEEWVHPGLGEMPSTGEHPPR